MTATNLRTFRRRLTDMVRRLSGERLQLRHEVLGETREPEVGITHEQYTTDDLSREEADEEAALALLGNEEELLAECVAALDRVERGTFGRCERCGRSISQRRLEAAPHARRCIRCTRETRTQPE